MAIGVRCNPSTAGVKRVEDLLAKHRFDAGCGIVRNGTPTNNTDSAVSGWRPPSTESEQLFGVEDKPPVLTPGPLGERDGHRLLRLLGLSEEFVRRLPNATATDISEALAINRAASFGTLFEFVKEFLSPLIERRTRQQLRTFFHENVSGRGILPAIRVGRQPYGIVVTSDWKSWTMTARANASVPIENKIFALLQTHRPAFQELATKAQTPGTGSVKPFEHSPSHCGSAGEFRGSTSRTAARRQRFRRTS
jgi:hypothetical protein